jgi:hypothetical protein
VLSDTGMMASVTLELPMAVDYGLGVLMPGALVQIGSDSSAWRRLVRSTSVSTEWSDSLTARQIVELERDY